MAGVELLIEARACAAASLRDLNRIRSLCDRVIAELDLHVVGAPQWHVFPGEAGVTGLYLLSESHLAVHTFPEDRLATFNLYCCRPRPEWPWPDRLRELISAEQVRIRAFER